MALCGYCGGAIVKCGGWHVGLGRVEKPVEKDER